MRLKNLNLTPLETRRIWGDLIEVYIIMNGIEVIASEIEGDTNLFSHRVINYCNALPQTGIDAISIN